MEKQAEPHRGDVAFQKTLDEELLTKLCTEESVKICESPWQLPCKHNNTCYIQEAPGNQSVLKSQHEHTWDI